MHFLGLVLFMLTFNAFGECRYKQDLFVNVRSLFQVPDDRKIMFTEDLKKEKPLGPLILLEQISEDKIYSDDLCPEHMVRLFHALAQDEFRRCNAIIRSDYVTGIHVLLYQHCIVY